MRNVTSLWEMAATAAQSSGIPMPGRSSKGRLDRGTYGRENASEEWDGFNFIGMCPIYLDAAVSLASFYEAAAYAVWAGKRQPTEPKWEIAARLWKCDTDLKRPSHMRGVGREWTQSPYSAYPKFKAATSAMRGGPFISLTSCIEWRPWIT